MTMKVNLIVAGCKVNGNESLLGIGSNGSLPWKLPNEMKHFSKLTIGDGYCNNAVLMGRKTWESIPAKFRPLPRRFNIVLTSQLDYDLKSDSNVALKLASVEEAFTYVKNNGLKECWIIGGASIYKEVLAEGLWDRIYLTKIHSHFDCDTFFPSIDTAKCKEISVANVATDEQTEGSVKYKFHVFEKAE